MSQRQSRLSGEIGTFIRQYARKRYPHMDPNDRGHDRKIEQMIRHMKPEELDRLMGDERDTTREPDDGLSKASPK